MIPVAPRIPPTRSFWKRLFKPTEHLPAQLSQAERGFQNMMDRQGEAARLVAGAQQSQWNGQWQGEKSWGYAYVDGRIGLDQKRVIGWLHHMWRHAGQQHDPQTLANYRHALLVMYHENLHMLARNGEQRVDSNRDYIVPAVMAIEEGATQEFAQRTINGYIRELDLERIAPGISGDVSFNGRPLETAAVSGLCEGLAQDFTANGHQTTSDDVLRWLNQESATNKWPAAASWVMETSGLNQQIPPGQRPAAQQRIQWAMQREFDKLSVIDMTPPIDQNRLQAVQLAALGTGQDAARQAQAEVNKLRAEYPGQPLQPSIDRDATIPLNTPQVAQQVPQLLAYPPPDPRTMQPGPAPQYSEGQSQMPRQSWQPEQGSQQPTGVAPARPGVTPDMQRAMALTSAGVPQIDAVTHDPKLTADQTQPVRTGAHRDAAAQHRGSNGPQSAPLTRDA